MEEFRHNLTPVEVKTFLKITAKYTEWLLIRYCYKVQDPCPRCGRARLCRSGAISLFSSTLDKLTHELTACLQCRFVEVNTVLTTEKL